MGNHRRTSPSGTASDAAICRTMATRRCCMEFGSVATNTLVTFTTCEHREHGTAAASELA